jgi:hypothetical protein
MCVALGILTSPCAAKQSIPDWLVFRNGQTAFLLPTSDGKAHLCESSDQVWRRDGKLRLTCPSAAPGTKITVRGRQKAASWSAFGEHAVYIQLLNGRSGWTATAVLAPIVPTGTSVEVIGAGCAAQFARFQEAAQNASLRATYSMCKGTVVEQAVSPREVFLTVRFARGGNKGRFSPNVVMFVVDPDHFESWKPLSVLDF